jgi:kexin
MVGPGSDVDFFRFEITDTDTREYFVYTTGDTDTRGTLYNAGGVRLNESDDAHIASGRYNFMLTGRLARGTYYLSVAGGRTDEQGAYTLHLGVVAETTGRTDATPIEVGEVVGGVFGTVSDVDFFVLELSQDAVVAVRSGGQVPDVLGAMLDSKGTEIVSNREMYLWPYPDQFAMRVVLAAGTYYLRVEPARSQPYGSGAGFYNLYVDAAPEPGSTRATAAVLGFGVTGGGVVDPASDVDWFRIDLDAAEQVFIAASVYRPTRTGIVDIKVELTDSNGNVLPRRFEYWNLYGIIHYVYYGGRLEAGTYYLRVSAAASVASRQYLVALRHDPSFDRSMFDCPKPSVDAPAGVEDGLFGCQWHLFNDGSRGGVAGEDINVGSVWNTTMGAGINVVVVDTGVHWNHPDLIDNALPSRNHSYVHRDVSGVRDSHGTSAAGIIAARDNSIGVRGVAPRASFYAYDLLQALTVANAADAARRGRVYTSVSSNSWVLSAHGAVGRSSRLWDLAMRSGLREGDGGRGVVYVFAAGNDDRTGGWASLEENNTHHGVTAVCAVDQSGRRRGYSESGPNLWVCAPSGSNLVPGIISTRIRHRYRDTFSGTSAATPQVSGVAALVRAANRALTWRDVKLILAETARKNDPLNAGWQQGGRRRVASGSKQHYEFNHQYGFGVVDAEAAVQLAGSWSNLPSFLTASVASAGGAVSVPDKGSVVSQSVEVDTEIDFVEWVEVVASFVAPAFRHLRVELVSPSGAMSVLSRPAAARHCRFGCGLMAPFRFGSARHLGEDPTGTWTLRVRDEQSGGTVSRLDGWSLTVYGHRSGPAKPGLGGVTAGDGSLTVSWSAPSDPGDSAVTGYDVRHIRSDASDKTDANWTVVADAAAAGARSYTISNLMNGVRRDVQVRAKNSSRVGRWSADAAGTPGASNGVPFFVDGDTASREVDENTNANMGIGSVVGAVDPDSDTLVYELGGADAASFGIVSSTGQLQTKAPLDHETRRSYSVTVTVRDNLDDDGMADTETDDTITVTVGVADVNEPPVVTGPAGPSFPENGTGSVGSYSAVDPEGSAVTWGLSGDDAAGLQISSAGVLSFATAPDFESAGDADGDNVYEVTVEASDGSMAGTLDVEVAVTDVNEPPVLSGPATAQVDEAITTVATYTAADPDNDSITWTLAGIDSGDFSVSAGKLSFRVAPDFESAADHNRDNVYSVTISASDGSFTVARQVTVTVRNVDEAGSVSLSPSHPQVGTRIGASLSDPDGGVSSVTWVWEWSSDGQTWTVITAATGTGYTPVAADEGRWLRAQAQYRDQHGSGKTATGSATSATRAAPPANRAPAFAQSNQRRSVAENTAAGVAVGAAVAATDADRDPLTYTLDTSSRTHFDIDSGTGGLLTKTQLDHETRSSYTVRVTATDPSGRSATATVTIEVTDVDEAGRVTLSATPLREGLTLRAILTEPDGGVTGQVWLWERSTNGNTWTTITGATRPSLRLAAAHIGNRLRVTLTYTDAHGPGKTLQAQTFATVQALPTPPLPLPPPPPPGGGPAPPPSSPPGGGPAPPPSSPPGGGPTDVDESGEELPPGASELFEDVKVGVWYESAVSWMILHQVTSGCAPTRFCPEQNLTRQQFVTFLWRAVGRPVPEYLGSEAFSDVAEGVYADQGIGWAVSQKVTAGCTPGTFGDTDRSFCPTDQVTRGQMATLLYRLTEADYIGASSSYTDVQPDAFYNDAVTWLTDFGVVPGCGPELFCPDRPATRAEAALFINGVAIRPHIWGQGNTAFIPTPSSE